MSDDIEDPVETMLKKTGCIELHYKVQECIADTNDWRKCQKEVHEFKYCMQKYSTQNRNIPSDRTTANI